MRNHTGSIFNMTCISDGSGGLPTEISLPFATIFAVIALAGVTGNILVILSICLCGKMRTAMNFVLVNMAIADVGNLLSCAPEIIQILFSRSWLFPNFFCPTIRYLQIGFLYSSVGFQIAVSLERFVAIKYPLKSGLFCTKRNVLYSIAMIWVFNGSFAVPYGLHEVFPVFPDCPAYICAPKDVVTFGMHSWFKMTEFFVYYLIPMVIIFFVYCEILKELCTVTRENPRRSSAEQGRKAKRRVVMMLLSSVVIYFISYSPVQLFFLANRFFGHYEPGPITILICNALTWANSAMNPLIYSVFSTKFRTQFRLLLSCKVTNGNLARNHHVYFKRPPTTAIIRYQSNVSHNSSAQFH